MDDAFPPQSPGEGDLALPRLNCDLVMKGGITSGVVYPKAVVGLSQLYRIRSIGGTSVGAIAAVLTAAAEYWRQTASPADRADQHARIGNVVSAMREEKWDSTKEKVKSAEARLIGKDENPLHGRGFAGLYAIPTEIGRDLLGMFQPHPTTQGLFSYLTGILLAETGGGRVLAAIWRQFILIRSVVALVSALMALSLLQAPRLGLWIAGITLALILTLTIESTLFTTTVRQWDILESAWFPVLAVSLLVIGPFLLIHEGLGWRNVLRWITDQSRENPQWAVAAVIAIILVTGWPWIRKRLPASPGANRLLNASMSITTVVATVVVLYNARDWIADNAQEVGAAGAGFSIGWIAGGIIALFLYLAFALPRNMNGICTGLGTERALTNWLTAKIDRVAGLSGATHLTFGQLHAQGIDVEVITSDLTRGVPLDIPGALVNYTFRPADFSRLFPSSVLSQLGYVPGTHQPADLLPFPPVEQIPIVVAARMSMSFPILFSTVPVFHTAQRRPDLPNHLSDGGIVSNFPLHKFDRALPPWPTFAIDLLDQKGPPPKHLYEQIHLNPIKKAPDQRRATQSNAAAIRHAHPEVRIDSIQSLATRILNTARGWMDNSQKTLPGYAERIVAIHLYEGEGGLNLNMSEEAIRLLADRGMYGLDGLVTRWAPSADGMPNPDSEWEQHRWVRYRILMRELEQLAREWAWVFEPQAASLQPTQAPSFREILARRWDDPWMEKLIHRWEVEDDAREAEELTTLFRHYVAEADDGVVMTADTPGAANLDPDVFDRPKRPAPRPRRLMIPPFE